MNELTNITTLNGVKKALQERLEGVITSYVEIGWLLKKVRDNELYKEEGLTNVYEFAQKNFNISQSWATRWMQINDEFSIGGNSPELDTKWNGYGSSKLSEMLTLPGKIREEIPETATVKDIRDAKEVIKSTSEQREPQSSLFDEPIENDINWMQEVVKALIKDKKTFEHLYDLTNKEDEEITDEKVVVIVAPSKFRMLTLVHGNAMFRADKIKIMPFRGQGDSQNYSYKELTKEFIELFPEKNKEEYLKIYEETQEKAVKENEPEKEEAKTEEKPEITRCEENLEEETPKPERIHEKEEPRHGENVESAKCDVALDIEEEPVMDPPILEEKTEEIHQITEDVVQEGKRVEEILKSGNLDDVKRLIKLEFTEPEEGFAKWLTKVINV